MKVSIIIAVYNSHEAVRRQLLYFKNMQLPGDVELVVVDDGSIPPLDGATIRTGFNLAWTQGLARNIGCANSAGEYLLFTDIDHILSRAAIEDVRNFTGDRMMFHRYFGVLTEEGQLTQDMDILYEYGLKVPVLARRGLYASVHLNTFAIKRSTFVGLEGYDARHSSYGYHPVTKQGDDCAFNKKWNNYARDNGLQLAMGSDIYMFPVGRYHRNGETNPMGLFHDLSYDGQTARIKGDECRTSA